jgi:hypothetical protein
MDNTIRKNKFCIIGMPKCDFVFSSTRNCFIGYGFSQSSLEMTILKSILEKKGIQPVEAGNEIAPGQNAFCSKICSEIITSQFCIILVNNDVKDGIETPNANVNMEYGLMLGFQKFVIPFKKCDQELPFNIAGLDTIKYSNQDFERLAEVAIDKAILATEQRESSLDTIDQQLETWLLTRNLMMSYVDNQGEQDFFRMGVPLRFNLLHDFSGEEYSYLGKFTMLRPESIVNRISKMTEILDERKSSIPNKLKYGVISENQKEYGELLFENLKLFIIVNSLKDKQILTTELETKTFNYPIEIISLDDMLEEIKISNQ